MRGLLVGDDKRPQERVQGLPEGQGQGGFPVNYFWLISPHNVGKIIDKEILGSWPVAPEPTLALDPEGNELHACWDLMEIPWRTPRCRNTSFSFIGSQIPA